MANIAQANVRVVSDGTVQGTKILLLVPPKEGRVGPVETIEIKPVTDVMWAMNADTWVPELMLTVALGQIDATLPIEFVDMIREQTITIQDVTPWYARLWLWLKGK